MSARHDLTISRRRCMDDARCILHVDFFKHIMHFTDTVGRKSNGRNIPAVKNEM